MAARGRRGFSLFFKFFIWIGWKTVPGKGFTAGAVLEVGGVRGARALLALSEVMKLAYPLRIRQMCRVPDGMGASADENTTDIVFFH